MEQNLQGKKFSQKKIPKNVGENEIKEIISLKNILRFLNHKFWFVLINFHNFLISDYFKYHIHKTELALTTKFATNRMIRW